ncbi:MAG TPA: MTH938/NDUFAF3 family protein [Gemmataceae bacterium]|nr:MTH938/NDUFAF3 family protein [Gemmataceae bacterium]
MKWGKCRFGRLKVDGEKYRRDVVLDRGVLHKRKKKPSQQFREQFGHTPVSLPEAIPWECKCLVIGTGMESRLPIMDDVRAEVQQRGVELVIASTPEAGQFLRANPAETNAILHVTC